MFGSNLVKSFIHMTTSPIYICITPFFPSSNQWQGAYVLDQVKAIQRNSNYKIVVFKTCSLFGKQDDYVIDGVLVHTIRPLLMPSYILNGLTEKIVGKMFLQSLKHFGIDINQIGVVHCHTINHSAFGFAVKEINPNVKVLVQLHDLDPLTLRNGKWASRRWNRRYRAKKSINALNRADLLVCISEPVKDTILNFPHPRKGEVYSSALRMLNMVNDMPSIHPKHIYVLNNGVDCDIFSPLPVYPGRDTFRIGCIANFQELKDHYTLVEAFNILIEKGYTQMRLSLLGSGPTQKRIYDYLDDHHLLGFVEWKQEVQHNRLPEYYHTLDLFVLPSYYEGFGCVYTEAYACGVPFICCYDQGAAELIPLDEQDLWLVPPKNPQQLAERIEKFYLERNNQNLIKSIDINKLIIDFLGYIDTL